VPADLVREDGGVDDAEAPDAEHAQVWVDDARLRGGANARGRRLQSACKPTRRSHREEGGGNGLATDGVERCAAVAADVFFNFLVRDLQCRVAASQR
jgi:hypothetical protein